MGKNVPSKGNASAKALMGENSREFIVSRTGPEDDRSDMVSQVLREQDHGKDFGFESEEDRKSSKILRIAT